MKKDAKSDMVKLVQQFVSYFFVGGIAALTEWAIYILFDSVLAWHYLLATALSFMIATLVNWIIGRHTTFRNAYKGSVGCEIAGIYFISAIGLFLNLIFMHWFVRGFGLSGIGPKIIATGCVFIWNFISRKIFLYKV